MGTPYNLYQSIQQHRCACTQKGESKKKKKKKKENIIFLFWLKIYIGKIYMSLHNKIFGRLIQYVIVIMQVCQDFGAPKNRTSNEAFKNILVIEWNSKETGVMNDNLPSNGWWISIISTRGAKKLNPAGLHYNYHLHPSFPSMKFWMSCNFPKQELPKRSPILILLSGKHT